MARVFGKTDRQYLSNVLKSKRLGWQQGGYVTKLDEAFAAMEAAYESRDSGLQLILGDRHLENLRGDPRYEAMVEKMGIRVD